MKEHFDRPLVVGLPSWIEPRDIESRTRHISDAQIRNATSIVLRVESPLLNELGPKPSAAVRSSLSELQNRYLGKPIYFLGYSIRAKRLVLRKLSQGAPS